MPTTIGLSVAQPPPLTCVGYATRQRRLFYLFVYRGTLTCYDMGALSLFLFLMACTQWFQLILTSFRWYVIPTGYFPQKSLSRNPRIGFPLSPSSDYALLPLTHDPPLPVLARYRLVVSRPYACSTSVYVQNLLAVHAFAVVRMLVCTFCLPSLTSYVLSCFIISHPFMACSLWGWALFDCGLFFIQPVLLLFFAVLHFLPYHSTIPTVMLFDPSLLGLFGSVAYFSLNDSI